MVYNSTLDHGTYGVWGKAYEHLFQGDLTPRNPSGIGVAWRKRIGPALHGPAWSHWSENLKKNDLGKRHMQQLPSGKLTENYGKSPLLMGKSW